MSYASLETSISSGNPLELFHFAYGEVEFFYSSHDGDVSPYSYGGANYVPYTIKRSTSELTEVMSRNTLNIDVPCTCPIAQLFVSAPPEQTISITIFRVHFGVVDGITIFKGRVVSCEFRGFQATLSCESVFTRLKVPGLRMVYDVMCPHALYSPGCGVIKTNFSKTATITAVNGRVLTLEAQAGDTITPEWLAINFLKGGMLSAGLVRRMITDVATIGNVQLMHNVPTGLVGQKCIVYLGCDHLLSDCHTKFNNHNNYGGFPWIPDKNPYADNVVWG